MRTVNDHKVGNGAADVLDINVIDEPGAGGASHAYMVTWVVAGGGQPTSCHIDFQNGPIKEAGVNGVTQEALLAIVIDRLRSFQAGPFASDYNAMALDHCQKGLQ